MEYTLIIALIVVMVLNFIGNILIAKKANNEQRIHSLQIYRLYEEIKKFNDNHSDNKNEKVGK